MRFLWPDVLWALLLAPALIAGYVWLLRRRRKAAVRYASLAIVREAIGPGQRIRRHVPPALFLVAMTLAILAAARPSATVTLPADYLTLVVAMDVSRSMLATDVEPNRIHAAQVAARAFVEELPSNVRVGIVSFAGTAQVVQNITDRKDDLLAAIDRFQLQRATATGSGLLLSLATLLPQAGIDLEAAIYGDEFSRWNGYGGMDSWGGVGGGGGVPLDAARKAAKTPKKAHKPAPAASYAGGAIVLLSDGRRTTGPDPIAAARLAADHGVRVYTVGFGTLEGAMIGYQGWSFYARLDEETLKAVARITGAEYFHAGTAADLKKVYQHLSSKFALEKRETEVGALFSATAALLLIAAGLLSLLWFHRRA